jgi:lysophospholipase L1-like esterase
MQHNHLRVTLVIFTMLALLVVWATTLGPNLSAATTEPAMPLAGKLVCVGDSITAGEPHERIGRHQSYVDQMQAAMTPAAKAQLVIVNQGRSGWSTQQYLDNANTVVKAMPADATVITIMLGTNDTRFGDKPTEIADRCVTNLRKLIALYQNKAPHARFVILTAPAVYPAKLSADLRRANYNEQTPAKIEAIRTAYIAMAKADGLQVIDVSALPEEAHSLEGVHPTADGQKDLARVIWKGLTEHQ